MSWLPLCLPLRQRIEIVVGIVERESLLVLENLDMVIDERIWLTGGLVLDIIKLWAPLIATNFMYFYSHRHDSCWIVTQSLL